jgi:DNA-binding ferritin-like protein
VKGKISATVEEPLLDFLDSLPGRTRSEKLERVLARFKRIVEDQRLREQLAEYREDEDERQEADAWERTFDEAMWRE